MTGGICRHGPCGSASDVSIERSNHGGKPKEAMSEAVRTCDAITLYLVG